MSPSRKYIYFYTFSLPLNQIYLLSHAHTVCTHEHNTNNTYINSNIPPPATHSHTPIYIILNEIQPLVSVFSSCLCLSVHPALFYVNLYQICCPATSTRTNSSHCCPVPVCLTSGLSRSPWLIRYM